MVLFRENEILENFKTEKTYQTERRSGFRIGLFILRYSFFGRSKPYHFYIYYYLFAQTGIFQKFKKK